MPNWKKVIVSGSDASLNSLYVTNAVTASIFSGSFTGSIFGTASYALDSNLLDGKDSTVFATTGSNTFIGDQIITGSLFTTGSNRLIGTTTLTGSVNITGSTTQIGNNSLVGNTSLSGSVVISGSFGDPTNPNIKIYGDLQTDGVIKLLPVSTNINPSVSGSYIYVSGTTDDLYFTQNGGGYANTTRLRWLEGNLYTGLLNGGVITSQSSTVYQISSGSGIIVDLNASLNDNPYPIIQYLNWPNLSASIAPFTASYQQAFVGIDSTNNIFAQGTPFSNGQFDNVINIGNVLFQNQSTINGFKTQPSVAYGFEQSQNIFNRAFGPLKLSGFTLAPSGSSTGSLVVGSGTAYAPGSNYIIDPNEPSYAVDPGTNTSKIFRYYQSGSSWVYNTNAGAGFTTIDPANYSNSGSLTAVGAGNWSIQRVFWYPNSVTKAIVVYYGNAIYSTENDALANIPFESFVEAPNTAANAIYLGAIIINGNGVFTNAGTFTIYPGGLFRQVGGSGGGGSTITQTLAGLSDVNISGPTNYQPLVYDITQAKWINASVISASIYGNAATATSASHAVNSDNAISSSYALVATSASYAATSSYADNFTVANTLTVQTLIAQVITSSTEYITGSTIFGSQLSNTHQFTGSVSITGSLTVNGPATINNLTGSLFGTASHAITSSFITASNVFGPYGSNSIISASYAFSASHAPNALTASYAISASQAISSSYALSSSYAFNATSASYAFNATTASFALTSSYAINIEISGAINNVDYIDFDLSASFASAVGRLGYDSGEGTLQFGLAGGNVTLNIGEDLYQYVYNATTASLSKGQVVYISGSQGNRIAVKLASAVAEQGSANTLGFVAETIAAGAEGWVMTEGNLRKLNTVGLIGGQLIYLGTAPGTYTQTPPVAPDHGVRLGYAERIDNTQGSIYVKIDNGYELGELHDVIDNTTTSSYGDLLVKSGSVWTNSKQLTGSYGLTGSLTFINGGITGSLLGTASFAITSSYAISASQAISSSYALSSSYAFNATSASYAVSSSYAISASQAISASYAISASQATTASYAIFALSASNAPGFTTNFSQSTAATTWSFSHNLNTRNPLVQVYSPTYAQLIPNEIVGIDAFTVEIRFDYAQAGYAVASNGGGLYVTGSTPRLVQNIAAATWSFQHNLGTKYPGYEVYDSNDNVITPAGIHSVDINNAEIYFAYPTTGVVIANFSGISGSLDNAISASFATYAVTASYSDAFYIDQTLTDYATIASSANGSNTVFNQATGSFTSAFFKYTVSNGANARSGEILSVWNGASAQFTDNSTVDIGVTTAVTASVIISGANVQLNIQTNTAGWKIKSLGTFM